MTDTIDDQEALLQLLARTSAVLFDFDGPVCRLFPHPTTEIARHIKRTAEAHWGALDPDVRECHDSHHVLRPLWRMYERLYEEQVPERPPSRHPLEFAEMTVAEAELAAAANAVPAEHIDELLTHLRKLRMRLVVVSNNAERAIQRCLEGMGLTEFEAVFGRDPHDARLMKPHPHCVRRALAHLGVPARDCLLVGDQITDLTAARTAGTRFLGWTQDEIQAKEMERDGSDAVVSSHLPLAAAARRLFETGHSAESVNGRAVPTRT
ncbi:HAD family hydrolase [Streptomyces sp. NPDC001107]